MKTRQIQRKSFIESEDEDDQILIKKKQSKPKNTNQIKQSTELNSNKPQRLKKKKLEEDDYQPDKLEIKQEKLDQDIDSSLEIDSQKSFENQNNNSYKEKPIKNKNKSSQKNSSKQSRIQEENKDEGEIQLNYQGEEYLQAAEQLLPYFIQQDFIRDEDGLQPNDPDYNPSTLHIPIQAFQKLPPMFKQYWNAKKKNYDCIVFFRCGRWKNVFYRDALTIAQIFGNRVGFWGKDRPALVIYENQYPIIVRGLLERGMKICCIEQMEKGELQDNNDQIVKRQITQLISRGTFQDQEENEYQDQRFLMSIIQDVSPSRSNQNQKYIIGVSLVDATTNQFFIDQFLDDEHCNVLRGMLLQLKPLEIIIQQDKLNPDTEKMIKSVCNPVFYVYKKENRDIQHILQQLKQEFLEGTPDDIQQNWNQINVPQIQLDVKINTNLNEGIYEEEQEINNDTLQKNNKISLSADYPQIFQEFEKQFQFELEMFLKENPKGDQASFQKDAYSYYYALQSVYMLQFYLRKLLLSDTVYRRGKFMLLDMKLQQDRSLYLDSQALESLEIFQANLQTRVQEKGSLYNYINRCGSGMGQRMLRKWLEQPLFNYQNLKSRQMAVVDLFNNIEIADEFNRMIHELPDLEKAITKIFNAASPQRLSSVSFSGETFGQAKLKELYQLLKQLKNSQNLIKIFNQYTKNFTSQRLKRLTKLKTQPTRKMRKGKKIMESENEEDTGLFPDIQDALADLESCLLIKNGEAIPMTGTSKEYDEALANVQAAHQELDNQLEYWKNQLKCDQIVYFHGRMRYQLEIPDSVIDGNRKPKELVICSKKKGFQRFQSDKIEQLILQLRINEDLLQKALIPFLQDYFQKFYSYRNLWYQIISCLSELDCLCSLALTSKSMKFACVPHIIHEDDKYDYSFKLIGGINPCLANSINNVEWIPNSIFFSKNIDCLLLTGPNMSGKSTLLRLTAILIILAQIGCLIPAQSFDLLPFDRIFCRIGASDRLLEGKSTFFIEMEETKTILQYSTDRSLVIIDELGRGTSTYDGVAIASSVLKFLTTTIRPKTLFATHYHILLDEFELSKNIQRNVMKHFYNKESEEVKFTYELIQGQAEKSFAANVARIAGLPYKVVDRAREIENQINKEEKNLISNRVIIMKFNQIINSF